MRFRRFLLTFLILGAILQAACGGPGHDLAADYPREIKDPDWIARPVRGVATSEAAKRLGITDTLVVWFKFKLQGDGKPYDIQPIENQITGDTVRLAEELFDDMLFESYGTRQQKRKPFYYGLPICPDCGVYKWEYIPPDSAFQAAIAALGQPDTCCNEGGPNNDFICPKLTYQKKPDYPQSASQQGMSGYVFVECIVDSKGLVSLARVCGSSGFEILDQCALKAAYGCLFVPAARKGISVPCAVRFHYQFRLN